jgi:hypothetical protein
MLVEFSVFASAKITAASDQVASTFLDPGAKAFHAELARWIYMIVHEKVPGRDRLFGKSVSAKAYCVLLDDRSLPDSHVFYP